MNIAPRIVGFARKDEDLTNDFGMLHYSDRLYNSSNRQRSLNPSPNVQISFSVAEAGMEH